MKTIYFVRHGESEENAGLSPVYQGEMSPLSQHGHEQARAIAERCEKLSFEVLLASPAVRTQETARYISDLTGKQIITDALFTERKMPQEMIGKLRNDSEASELRAQWERGFFEENVRAGTGENFSDLKERAGMALSYLAKRPESTLLVVSHGFLLRALVAHIVFGDTLTIDELTKVVQVFRTSNTGLTIVEHEPKHGGTPGLPPPKWLIRAWNDYAHLG